MDMRKSRVLKKIRNGETAFSFKLNLSDARAAEIAAMTGIDCLWTDMEHVPNDYAAIENIIRAAKIYDVDVLTRVKRGSYNDMINPLEADSTGIMIPHLMSLEEAKRVVYYTKFYPIGRRPIDGGNADGNYCLTDGNEYMKQANEERFNVVQIEDPEPLKDLDAICELEEIDMIFFGPADFSQGI
ncbi:MAG: aldolase, partial [Clostridia bacterium]|nr:aldolase [Clostridia bacterium]